MPDYPVAPNASHDEPPISHRQSVIKETSGPTILVVGNVGDGEFLKRDGETIVGAPGGGVGASVDETELAFTDVTTANSSTTKHGLLKKLSGSAAEFLNGLGNWVAVAAGITNGAGANVIPKSDGTNLGASQLNDNGTVVGVGGLTSSFPALKRSATRLQARLGDDSDFAPADVKNLNVDGVYLMKSAVVGGTMAVIAGDFNTLRALISIKYVLGTAEDGSVFAGIDLAAPSVVGITGGTNANGGTFRTVARTPAQITSDQNDFNPGGMSMFQRWSTDASRSITGMTFTDPQVDGQHHTIINVGSADIVLVNESASSTAANRFTTSTGANITLSAKQAADVVYDNTAQRWLVFKRN